MLVLYAGLALAVVVLASAIGVYVYARRKAAVQATTQCEHERRRRAVLDDFGDGAVWQMGQRATNAIGSGVPAGHFVTRRGFLPRMAVSFLLLFAGRKAELAVAAGRIEQDSHNDHGDHGDHGDQPPYTDHADSPHSDSNSI